jgi:hypothetical protein
MATPKIKHIAIPNIPPIRGSGIMAITAPNFVNNPKNINITPQVCITNRLATLVIETAAMFSEYVVNPTPRPVMPARKLPKPKNKF